MRIDDKRFYPANWQDFIHKGAITELFKAVPEINIPDLNASTIDKVEYQKDANGEYRMLVDYTDQDGVSHNTVLNPAITQRVIALANQEVVKHFLYNQNGQDINIQTMQFIDDKLRLQLVDGQAIELDLKPLVPRINVIGPDGEILQKDLNYQVADDSIIFVDLHGNETKLDFKKLVHVDAYQQDRQQIAQKFTDFDNKKLDKAEFDRFNLTNQAALDKKVDKTAHAADVAHLQEQINDRTTHAETDAATTKVVKQLKDWADPIHEDLQHSLDDKVNVVLFNELKKRVEDINSLKVSKTDYEHDKAGFATIEQLGDYVTTHYLTQNHYTKADIDAMLAGKVGQGALNDLHQLLQGEIDSKVNASELKADYYNKAEVDALIKTVQREAGKIYKPYVASDGSLHAKLINPDGSDVQREPEANV